MKINALASAVARRIRVSRVNPNTVNAIASIVSKRLKGKIGRPSPSVVASAVARRVSSKSRPTVEVRVDSASVNRIASATARRLRHSKPQRGRKSISGLASAVAVKLGYTPPKRRGFVDILASAVAKRLALGAEHGRPGDELPAMDETLEDKKEVPEANAA
jgi:hypothetical protein